MVLLLLAGSACAVRTAQPVREASLSHPEPEGDAERREREEWIESMHRAAPGVHWRQIERENRLRNRVRLAEAASLSAASSLTPGGVWLQRGPTSQTGRTWVTAPTADGSTLLIGSGDGGGGLFSGIPGSGVWAQRGNPIGSGVQELVVVPGTPEVWVTVGQNYSEVSVSRDQGVTWQTPGGLPSPACGFVAPRILWEPGSRRVYLLVTVPYCVAVPTYTLLRSDDGGLNFFTLQSASYIAAPDLWMKRVSGGPLYFLTDSGLLSSSNQGASFGLVGSLPAGSGDKLRLAGSEAGAPTFYAMRSNSSTNTNTLYASTNGGGTWSTRGTVSDYSRSNGAFTASISTPGTLLLGGVNAYRSTNGGTSFSLVNNWAEYYGDPVHKLHADISGIDCFSYQGAETCFVNTDGGTYMSTDLGATFLNITQLGMMNSEIYSTLTSKNNPDLIVSGTQDQGLQQSTAASLAAMSFSQLISGDYGHLTSTAGDHNRLYAAYPGYLMVLDHEAAPQSIGSTVFPTARNRSWMPNILADPTNANAVYLTGDPLYRLNQDSSGWHSTAFAQNFSNGSGDYLTAFAISKVSSSYWYAVSAQGRFWYSRNQGATWTMSASLGPSAHYFYGTTMLASPTVATTCFVGGSGYSGPAVYKTTDGGVTWQAMGTGLPSTLVLGLAFDDPAKQNLYAAADAGAFTYDTASASWKSLIAGNAPIQGYWSVEGVPALQAVRFGTYGKGVWDYRLVPPGRDFYTVPPCRLVDTRLAVGPWTGPALQPQANRVFAVAGMCGVPSTARAISVNVTVVAGASNGYFALGASDKILPPTAAITFTATSVRNNNAVLELSTDRAGGFVVLNGSSSPAQFVLDVNGYFQ